MANLKKIQKRKTKEKLKNRRKLLIDGAPGNYAVVFDDLGANQILKTFIRRISKGTTNPVSVFYVNLGKERYNVPVATYPIFMTKHTKSPIVCTSALSASFVNGKRFLYVWYPEFIFTKPMDSMWYNNDIKFIARTNDIAKLIKTEIGREIVGVSDNWDIEKFLGVM
ncbi:MAG: hypothetical protein WC967_12195 [Balneolaceae bacterium]